MTGIKGKSGGQRPGAGRPEKPPTRLKDSDLLTKALQQGDPKAFLLAVMADADNDARLRVDAAKALLPYEFRKVGVAGKRKRRQRQRRKPLQEDLHQAGHPHRPPSHSCRTGNADLRDLLALSSLWPRSQTDTQLPVMLSESRRSRLSSVRGSPTEPNYFFRRSRISVSSTCSADGASGAEGAASAFFFSELITCTAMDMTNAMIVKSITVWANLP